MNLHDLLRPPPQIPDLTPINMSLEARRRALKERGLRSRQLVVLLDDDEMRALRMYAAARDLCLRDLITRMVQESMSRHQIIPRPAAEPPEPPAVIYGTHVPPATSSDPSCPAS
jgi:hypothetical protein